ncbi:MAG: MFS transporter [Robiginitomaculum sp.]|nr:MFS transporter [Robiginitomaculum sp.]
MGAALFALPVPILCKNFGRRLGFSYGTLLGILGAAMACYALLKGQFILFCIAYLLIGCSSAFVQQYRFAASDHGSDAFKSRAISLVLTGGVLAAILGPQTALYTKDLLLPTPFAGGFLGMIVLLIAALFVLAFLKPSPVAAIDTALDSATPRPLIEIIKQPVFFIALLCSVSCFALMTFMMTGAPLAITHHGHSQQHAIIGIQWHVMAMYAPSFVTGKLIVKFGKIPVIATGLLLLFMCAAIALGGKELWNFWAALIFLGIGWNFGFIGSTALLSESYRDCEKNNVQGLHDTILFSFVACAAILSGSTFHAFGWNGIASALFPIAGLSILALLWLYFHQSTNVKQTEI